MLLDIDRHLQAIAIFLCENKSFLSTKSANGTFLPPMVEDSFEGLQTNRRWIWL